MAGNLRFGRPGLLCVRVCVRDRCQELEKKKEMHWPRWTRWGPSSRMSWQSLVETFGPNGLCLDPPKANVNVLSELSLFQSSFDTRLKPPVWHPDFRHHARSARDTGTIPAPADNDANPAFTRHLPDEHPVWPIMSVVAPGPRVAAP